jgi:hypothetical protein
MYRVRWEGGHPRLHLRNSLETDVYNIPQQIGPLAELLPFTFLIEALNVSLEQKAGAKILEVLATTLLKV